MNYCNRKATALLEKTAVTLDNAERTQLLNQAEKLMAKDVPSIPMFVRPGFVIRKNTVKGPVFNTTTEGSPWNANTWTTS
jgi:ABC-type transport system substrate-binding protein